MGDLAPEAAAYNVRSARDQPMTDAAVPNRLFTGRPLQPLKALQAFGRLARNKEDTAQVFEIMRALAGRSDLKGYSRLICTPGGGEIAYARRELAPVLSDPDWLAQFGSGTVGEAYRRFMQEEDLSAEGLAMESRTTEPAIDDPHVIAWYGRRLRDVHDIWHVLSGYGRDALGEACVVSFSYSQTGHKGFGFIGLAAAWEISREAPKVRPFSAVREAFGAGRRAGWLPAEDYEALFAEPLEAARRRLNILPPKRYLAVPEEVRRGLKLRAAE
jgi:ubiquinone biosynthesis protein COQ4